APAAAPPPVPAAPPPVPIAPAPAEVEFAAPPAVPQASASSARPVLSMSARPPPLLMDVTPYSLGIEMAGGFCQHLIRRNAPIPAEQTRIFTTAKDDQTSVRVSVCQGEERLFADNQQLGEIELSELRQAPRGEVKVEVAFLINADGTLEVRAKNEDTGRVESVHINLLGGADDAELEAMRARQEALVERS
ncbi:MAG: Hsp70 family protein, partial [Deltaproteobacteria bacterium]|nr:Hsp70 family protein [Deltaproteobacteria bacterium]